MPVAAGLIASCVLLGRLWSESDEALSSNFFARLNVFYKPDWDQLTHLDVSTETWSALSHNLRHFMADTHVSDLET